MASEWYVSRGGKERGPFSSQQIRDFAQQGRLLPSDLLRQGGTGPWAAAAKVKGLVFGPAAKTQARPEADQPASPPVIKTVPARTAAPVVKSVSPPPAPQPILSQPVINLSPPGLAAPVAEFPAEAISITTAPLQQFSSGAARCFLAVGERAPGLPGVVRQRLQGFLEDELRPFACVTIDPSTMPPTSAEDLVISCKLHKFDYGSRMMRYFLTFISLFGPGSCWLELDVNIQYQGRASSFRAKARQWIGFFGGDSQRMMQQNYKLVGNRIGIKTAQLVSQRWLINRFIYNAALAGLIFALLGVVCLPFSPIALLFAGPAAIVIHQRQLPRRFPMAVGSVGLSVVTMLAYALLIVMSR